MNAPAPRGSHTAVWTGTEMIIWGAGNWLDTGGRYDPRQDAWMPTSVATDVPEGRYLHTAVWTGSEMIVWGGATRSGAVNTGGRYDPLADTWTATSTTADTPSPRYLHAAVWSGAAMIVWGGIDDVAIPPTGVDGGRYDPLTDGWTPTATIGAPAGRWEFADVWTGREMTVWGGLPATTTGGRYCACPDGLTLQRDADGDGFGDPAGSFASCDGSIPMGYVSDATDCNDADPDSYPGAPEVCDGLDNDCDSGADEDEDGVDSDADGVGNLCDNCRFAANLSQTDGDQDGEGDLCDLDDGRILILPQNPDSIDWQDEAGYTHWNVYAGDLAVLRESGIYTQTPGSNPLADRHCGLSRNAVEYLELPAPGQVAFSLVTGVIDGEETDLGYDSAGTERPNTNPCPPGNRIR